MKADLLTMSIGDIFDEAFDLYKRNFALLAGIGAIIHVPSSVLYAGSFYLLGLDRFAQSGRTVTDAEMYRLFGALAGLLGIACIATVLYIVQNGVLATAVSSRYLAHPISIGTAYRRVGRSLLPLLATWAILLIGLIALLTAVLFFIAVIVGVALAGSTGGGGTGPGTFIAIMLAVLFYIFAFVAAIPYLVWFGSFLTQIIVIEGGSFFAAIQRNIFLARGGFWRIVLAFLLITIIVGGLSAALQYSLAGAIELLIYPWLHPSRLVEHVVLSACGAVVQLFLTPYSTICLTLLYYDQRVRREGLDLLMMEQALRPAQAAEAAA